MKFGQTIASSGVYNTYDSYSTNLPDRKNFMLKRKIYRSNVTFCKNL